ncbi:MAG: AI-2E family transporter [Candidatus Brocadiaceae bacterium]|nr:AI-2E family transporter [Candidatus Brocadiaceae bacterium]
MGNDQQKILENMWIRVLLIGFIMFIICTLCYYLKSTLISLLLAFIVAYICNPVICFFERTKFPFSQRYLPRTAGIVLLVMLLFLTTAGFLTYAVPKTVTGINQVGTMVMKQYPKYQNLLDSWIKKYKNTAFFQSIKLQITEDLEEIHSTGMQGDTEQKLPPAQQTQMGKESRLQQQQAVKAAWAYKKYFPQAANILFNVLRTVFFSTFGLIGVVMNFIIFSIVSVYLLKDFNKISKGMKSLFPLSKRETAIRLLSQINDNLRSFLRGQLAISLILSFVYSTGLTLAGIPLSFLLGFIGGFGNMIPYVGTGIGLVLASALALFQFHDFAHLLYTFMTFGIGQLLEGTVITPRIMGKGLGLSPVMVILSLIIFSQLFGFLGLLLAIPITSTIKVFIDEFFLRYKTSTFYKG